jgi:ethanolamine utilization microcompartment shell protein EutS
MKPGPIRRAAGTIGLLALVPTAVMLIKGHIVLEVAAVRAGVTLGAVLVLGRIATWGVTWMADAAQEAADEPAQPPADTTARRPQGTG